MSLRVADVKFGYDKGSGGRGMSALVLHAVSVEVPDGSAVGILGPNGSGKTTLLRLMSGVARPWSGSVTLDGTDIGAVPRRSLARHLAVVPQETVLTFDYTVLEMVLMGRYPHLGTFELEGPKDRAAALAALHATGTAGLAGRPFNTLSGGEKQRVVIASALAQLDTGTAPAPDPSSGRPGATSGPPAANGSARSGHAAPAPRSDVRKRASPGPGGSGERPALGLGPLAMTHNGVLLLDEPTASLDLRYQLEVAALIKRLRAERGLTIVLSTHDLRLAKSVCTHAVLLSRGRVLADGVVANVLTPALIRQLFDVDPAVAAPLL